MRDIVVLILSFNVIMLVLNIVIIRIEINKLKKHIEYLTSDPLEEEKKNESSN